MRIYLQTADSTLSEPTTLETTSMLFTWPTIIVVGAAMRVIAGKKGWFRQ